MNIRAFLALAGSAVLFFSCNSKDSFIQQPIEGGDDLRGLLTLEGQDSELSLSHEGESFDDIFFTTDEAWSVKDIPDWVELTDAEDPDAGIGHAGTTKLSVRVRPNLSGADRSATLSITGAKSGNSLASLKLNQPRVIFELSEGDEALPFEWYNFQIKTDGKPAENQPSLKSVTLKTNVSWHQEFAGGIDTLFAYTSAVVSGGARIDLIPLEPCLAEEDIKGSMSLIPDFPGVSLSSEEVESINADWIRTLSVSQTHFNFVVDWVGDVSKDGPVFYELGKDLQTQSFSFTVKSDVSWSIAQASDWLEIGGAAVGQSIQGSEEPYTVELRTLYANPSAEPRQFSLLLAPSLPEDILEILPAEQVEGLGKTLVGAQKGLVFKVLEARDGDPLDVCSHEFENEDIGYDAKQKFNVYVKTPCAFADFCEFYSGENPWFDFSVSPSADTFPADSIYTMTFSLTAQNLDFEPASTPAAGPNYQKGYAFYSPLARAGANGSPCSLSPKAGLFAQGADVPQVPFVFSQKAFVFDIDWPMGLESILPRSTARHDVSVQSSGRWTCEVTYDSNNENPDLLNWVAGIPTTTVKGNTTLKVGSSERNNYDHSRTARVRFISINHREAKKESAASNPLYIIGQNEYRFIIREQEEENSAQVDDLGNVPAYQTPDDDCSFFLECGGPWVMIDHPDYLIPDIDRVDSEEGYKGRITFSIVPNVTPDIRPAGKDYDEIVISADEGLKVKTVKVRQDGFVFSYEQLMTELEAYNANPLGICNMTVTRGAKWHILDRQGNEVYAKDFASGNKELVEFLPAHNLEEGVFSVPFRLEVQEPVGVASQQLTLRQKGYQFDFVNGQLNFKELPSAADTREWDIVCSGPWGIKDNYVPEGFHCELIGNDTPNGSVRIWADNNLSVNPVNARIVFESLPHKEAGYTYEWGIALEQEPFIWEMDSRDGSYSFAAVPRADDSIPIRIKCSSRWRARLLRDGKDEAFDNHFTLTDSPGSDGFYPGDESGTGYYSLSFIPTENLEPGKAKQLIIRIESEYNSDENPLYADIDVTQDPFNWVVTAKNDYAWESTASNSITFEITSAGDWEILDSNENHISPSKPVNGWTFSWGTPAHDYPTTVTVKGSPNYNRSARELNFKIVSIPHETVGRGDECRKDVKLSQKAYEFYWNDGGDKNNLVRESTLEPLDDGYKEINVQCTSDWSIGATDSWLHAEKSANGNALRYKADKNVGSSTWSAQHDATITLTSNGLELKYNVHQKPYEFSLSRTSVNIDPEGTKEVGVDVTCSGRFSVTRGESWVILDGAQRDLSNVSGNAAVTISAVKDESGSEEGRTTTVTFESLDVSGLSRSVTLNQTPYILRFSGDTKDSYTFSPNQGHTENLQLDATVSWNIQAPDWIEVSPSSKAIFTDQGDPEEDPFTVSTTEKNPLRTRRSGALNLYASKDPNRIVATIPVYQDAFLVEGEPEAFDAVDPSSREVTVFSSNAWEIDQNASSDWIEFASMPTLAGSGSETGESVQIFVKPHSGTGLKTGHLVFANKTYPGVTRTASITQKAFNWTVTPSANSVTFPPLLGTQDKLELSVSTSGEFETNVSYATGDGWLEVTDGEGLNTGTVTVRPTSDNLETAARTATVTVSHKLFTYISSVYTITQSGYVFNVTCDEKPVSDGDVIYYDPAGGTRGIVIESTNGWNVSALPAWLTTSNALSGDGSAKATINMSSGENDTDALRSGVITVACDRNPAHNISITLTQDVFRTDISELPAFNERGTDPKSFYVFASGAWTVSGDNDWIHTDISGYTGNNAVNVTLGANPDTTARSGNVVVSYTPAGLQEVHTKTIAVNQDPLVFRASPASFSFDAVGAAAQTLHIDCSNGGWDITGIPKWLSVDPASSDEFGGDVTIVPSDCIEADTRSATLVVTSRTNPSIKHEITVSQQNVWISTNIIQISYPAGGDVKSIPIVATGPWHTNDLPDWIHLPNGVMTGSVDLDITVDPSTDPNERQFEIIFYLTDYPSVHTGGIVIVQDAYVAPPPSGTGE